MYPDHYECGATWTSNAAFNGGQLFNHPVNLEADFLYWTISDSFRRQDWYLLLWQDRNSYAKRFGDQRSRWDWRHSKRLTFSARECLKQKQRCLNCNWWSSHFGCCWRNPHWWSLGEVGFWRNKIQVSHRRHKSQLWSKYANYANQEVYVQLFPEKNVSAGTNQWT